MSRLLFLNIKKYVTCLAILSMSTALSAQPRVDGNTISWPDDGWYQVQDAVSYESLCQGGRSCEVPDGTYIVINLWNGQRFEGVVVPQLPPPGDGIVVVGNTISWPDDGWYQVQDAVTYESLCQGGLSCEVPDGTYIVINHTTGVRYENLVVDGDPVTEPLDPQISAASALPLLQEITAIINEKAVRSFLDDTASEVTSPVESTAMFPMPTPLEDFAGIFGPSEGESTDYVMAIPDIGQARWFFDYACYAGGDMRWYIGYSDFHDMVFDSCVVGDAIYNGTASRRMNTMRGEYTNTYYTGYARTGSEGELAELSGVGFMEYFSAFSQLYPLDYQASWNALQFSLSANGTQSLQISDYAVTRSFEKSFGSVEFPYCYPVEVDGTTLSLMEYTARDQINGQFDVSADWSEGNVLSVELDLTSLDGVRAGCWYGDASTDDFSSYDPHEQVWVGQIQVDAADGSSMTVRSVSDSETGTNAFVIDLDNGEQLGPVDWSGEYAVETRPWDTETE